MEIKLFFYWVGKYMKMTLEHEIIYFNTICHEYSVGTLDLLGFVERFKDLKQFHEFAGLVVKSK
jgi:hypothetical protein